MKTKPADLECGLRTCPIRAYKEGERDIVGIFDTILCFVSAVTGCHVLDRIRLILLAWEANLVP